MKKYYTDWKTITTTVSIGLALYIFFSYLQETEKEAFSQWVFWSGISRILIAPILLMVLLITRYSYVTIENDVLKFVYILFYRRTIDINKIIEINDQPTYKSGRNLFRSLFIFYKDKNEATKWIELRITIFPESTLGMLIKHLQDINPNIKLNKYSQSLIRGNRDESH